MNTAIEYKTTWVSRLFAPRTLQQLVSLIDMEVGDKVEKQRLAQR
jgi:hypothetical protein